MAPRSPGPSGPGRTHGVEMGKALDAVAARFGPAHTVVAHSLGTIATYLAIRHGWLGTGRLVLVAPMVEAGSLVDQFQRHLGFGPRTRRAFETDAHALVGLPISEFDARFQAAHADPVPTLVVHDRDDRQTPYADAVALVDGLPHADLMTTEGLGHRRVLRDPRRARRPWWRSSATTARARSPERAAPGRVSRSGDGRSTSARTRRSRRTA